MRTGAFKFSGKWRGTVRELPESGMGYTVVRVTLRDGRVFPQAVIDSGYLTRVRGSSSVPFAEDDIGDISPTHETWDWNEKP
jgi:hypothetical protein